MQISIITVDDLSACGRRSDTNGRVITRALVSLGLEPRQRIILKNQREEIIHQLLTLLDDGNIIIASGGLGPATADQALRSAIFAVTQSRPHLAQETLTSSVVKQVGTALYEHDQRLAYFLPGSSSAMEALLEQHVLPRLATHGGRVPVAPHILRISRLGEEEVNRRIAHLLENELGEISMSRDGAELEIMIRGRGENRAAAIRAAQRIGARICQELGHDVHGPLGQNLPTAVNEALGALGLTVSTLEVGTGGVLPPLLAGAKGTRDSSLSFKGALIVQDTENLQQLFQLPQDLFTQIGVISEEGASELARRTQQFLHTNLGLAITGVFGPHRGPSESPVGLVCFAVASCNDVVRRECKRFRSTSRRELEHQCAAVALRLLLDVCREEGG